MTHRRFTQALLDSLDDNLTEQEEQQEEERERKRILAGLEPEDYDFFEGEDW